MTECIITLTNAKRTDGFRLARLGRYRIEFGEHVMNVNIYAVWSGVEADRRVEFDGYLEGKLDSSAYVKRIDMTYIGTVSPAARNSLNSVKLRH